MRRINFIPFIYLFIISCNSAEKRDQFVKDSLHVDSIGKTPTQIGSNLTEDYFAKYSYHLSLININNTGSWATGFFIKKNNRIFLVSNYHVFTSTNTRTKKRNIDQAYNIWVVYKKIFGAGELKIDVKNIAKKNNPIYDYEKPDVYILEVTNLLDKDAIIYSIEDYISPIDSATKPDHIFSFGYGLEDGITLRQLDLQLRIPFFETYYARYTNGMHTVTNSYLAFPASSSGMSGSPVFWHLNNKFIFAGIISSHGDKDNNTTIVRPHMVENELNKMVSKN